MTSMNPTGHQAAFVRPPRMVPSSVDPLPRLLVQLLARAKGPALVERAVSRRWASALFQGYRHCITLRLTGPDHYARATAFMLDIGEVDWPLNGHFVADIGIDSGDSDAQGPILHLSALTVEEW